MEKRTKDKPWKLKTPPNTSEYTMHVEEKDGKEGLDTFKEHRDKIGLVILDLQMPDMGGEAVLQQIRELDPGMPVVYSTGMAYFESDGLPEHLRPTGMLKKPYLIATMSEIVKDALSRRP